MSYNLSLPFLTEHDNKSCKYSDYSVFAILFQLMFSLYM